jgi:SAM-dependent methyltransferase
MPEQTETSRYFLELTENIRMLTASEVQQGPFRSMTISEVTSWYGGDVIQKLIGSYERELWDWVEEAIASAPNRVINVGCAEGYYAVGMGMRLPSATIHAIDVDPAAMKACEATARANRAEGNLRLELGWTVGSIRNMLRAPGKSLLFVDCEGCEATLFDTLEADAYRAAEIIVECHDFAVPGISELLLAKLSKSHDTRILGTSPRKAQDFPTLAGLSQDLIDAALSEHRPSAMNWIYAKPKA